jgi:prophage tail gpP-like protein
MLMPSENVSLLIGGHSHSDWESYRIDSDLLIPADDWQVSLGINRQPIPASVYEGAPAIVKIGNDTVLSGLIDDIEEPVSKGEHSLSLSGRDYASVLVDCSAPIFVSRQVDLAEVVNKLVKPLGITKVRIDGKGVFEKVNVEPGETAWDVLSHAAEANGLWPWFDPDGTLVIGGADYSSPVVADIIMTYSGKGNNAKLLTRKRSIANRFSEITVLGQSHGTEISDGKNAILGKATDTSLKVYRPRIIIDSESDSQKIALQRARKLLADGRLESYTLTAVVRGHRITPAGKLWTPGQRIRVKSEPHGIDGIFFLMGRSFSRNRTNGITTELRLKEDGVWTLDAHPHKQKHKKAKTADGKVLEIVDVTL